MEGTERQIFYAKALLDGFEDKVKVRYAKTVIETSKNVVTEQDKQEYIDALNLFYDVFDEKLKDKKYYNEIAIQTIELLKIAIHRKTYDEKKLVNFVSKVVNFSKQFKSMETAKRYYGFNTMVLYNFIDRTGEKKNG